MLVAAGKQNKVSQIEGKGDQADDDGEEPEDQHGIHAAETGAHEAVREMIVVADPKGLFIQRAKQAHLREVDQRHGQHE